MRILHHITLFFSFIISYIISMFKTRKRYDGIKNDSLLKRLIDLEYQYNENET